MSAVEPIDLLGGATRTRTRPRGFAPWRPQADTHELLERVRAVIGEYENYLPLTIRQIFYRLVGVHEYEKTERAYKRLCENLNRARRARLISMSAIRDDGGTVIAPNNVWDSAEEFLATVRDQAKHVQLDRTQGQSTRLRRVLRSGWHGATPIPLEAESPPDVSGKTAKA